MTTYMEVPAGGRYRVNACGCELLASNETDVAETSSGGARSLTVATGRPKCKKAPFVTHWGIYPPGCTPIADAPGPAPWVVAQHWECRPRVGAGDWSKCINGGPEGCDTFWREVNRTGKREYRLVNADGTIAASKPQVSPVYGRMVGEKHAPDGTPLSALQVIQARKKPEPWVPSCDELHWLPDAPRGMK